MKLRSIAALLLMAGLFASAAAASSRPRLPIGTYVRNAGLIVVADVGQQHRILGQAKVRSPRLFMSFDAAASALQQYGITTFRGETEGWTPRYQTYRNGGA